MPTSRARTHSWRRLATAIAVLNAVAALGGAVGLITGVLDLGDLTSRLPFGSSVLGGLALALLVAAPQGATAVVLTRNAVTGAAASVIAGGLLVGWIVVEVLFLRVVAGLQVAYLVVGTVQVAIGVVLTRIVGTATPGDNRGRHVATLRIKNP